MEAHTRAVPRVTGSRPRLLSGFHSVAVMPDDNHEAKGHIVQSVHARDGVDPLDMPSRVAAGVNRGRKARRNLLTSDKFRAQKQNLGWLVVPVASNQKVQSVQGLLTADRIFQRDSSVKLQWGRVRPTLGQPRHLDLGV